MKDLSIALQNNSFSIVDATTKITECIDIYKNMLNSLNTDEKFVFRFSYIQKLMRANESETYQNIKIINYARTVDSFTRNAIRYVELMIVNCLQNRFEDSTGLMLDASLILNSQVWLAPSQDTTYEDMFSKQLQAIENAPGRIAVPLERANFSSEVQEYKSECIKFLKHALTFTNPSSISPQEMWSKILLSNPKSQTTWRNLTGLIESLLILPLTISQLERFSPSSEILKQIGDVD